MRKITKTTLGLETLESKRALSAVSVVSSERALPPQAAQVRVVDNRPVLNVPQFVGTYRGAGSLSGITVSGRENTRTIIAIATGGGGTVTGRINDRSVVLQTVRNSSGGVTVYLEGSPSAVNRNMRNLTYQGNDGGIRAALFIRNPTGCTRLACVYVPIRRF